MDNKAEDPIYSKYLIKGRRYFLDSRKKDKGVYAGISKKDGNSFIVFTDLDSRTYTGIEYFDDLKVYGVAFTYVSADYYEWWPDYTKTIEESLLDLDIKIKEKENETRI